MQFVLSDRLGAIDTKRAWCTTREEMRREVCGASSVVDRAPLTPVVLAGTILGRLELHLSCEAKPRPRPKSVAVGAKGLPSPAESKLRPERRTALTCTSSA